MFPYIFFSFILLFLLAKAYQLSHSVTARFRYIPGGSPLKSRSKVQEGMGAP